MEENVEINDGCDHLYFGSTGCLHINYEIPTQRISILKEESSNNCHELEACPPTPPNHLGRFSIDFEKESLYIVESRLSLSLQPGGWFAPKECKANDRVAIVVPKRGRDQMLPILLKNLHPMLMKQQIEYGIYVVEQPTDQDFNRGALFNIAFKEALKMKEWDCFIFHDIDLIPFDDRNLYNCPSNEGPRYMPIGINIWDFIPRDGNQCGGIIAFTTEQYQTINGFSNLFWNWGGEDDDLCERCDFAGFNVTRRSVDFAVYQMLQHPQEVFNPNRFDILGQAAKYNNVSGLNSIKYHIQEFKIKPTHVHIFVDPSIVKEELAKMYG
ncbi:beta-1,4-N-acetylgalactosaminyltransferase bre-4-like isoform X2 [Sitodiplosis mosellana]|uniref:beta-1,4-N-acetylgalactosaminyltransferase bre-4-like isoform X2 n=1 Tax=Sitodiplosis mosellana TaxID=263140 RepID=UPI0024445D3B|nr:beta-1,4-N-acetylgalactosaminyltransferase bre-4-like isoform X2 [Sitodiplosis mosellana]